MKSREPSEPLRRVGLNHAIVGGRRLLYFGGCDYYRFSLHARVRAAVAAGLRRDGLSACASRTTTGNRTLYEDAETALANFLSCEAAVLTPSGYLTNIAVAQALAGSVSRVLIDERAHASLVDASLHLQCSVFPFRHRDPVDLERKLRARSAGATPLVLTDGMFAHDGSAAPLGAYLRTLPSGGRILVDDAHGLGVLGATGRGTLEHEGVGRERIIQTASLGKAAGVFGGVIAGSAELRDQLWRKSRVMAGGTPLPPPLVGAMVAAVGLLKRNEAGRRRLFANADWLKTRLRLAGWDLPQAPGPIVSIVPECEAAGRKLSDGLLARGILPPLTRYGSGVGEYFRFVVSSRHVRSELELLVKALTRSGV